jgi:hypothetical protein
VVDCVSIEAINRIRGVRCTLAQKAVLTWLAEHAGPDLSCFPSVLTIASCCCAGERTVRQAIKDLERDGHISVTRRRNRASVYTVLTCESGRVWERQGAGAAGQEVQQPQVVVQERPLVVQERQVEPSGTTNEPPIEPSVAGARPDWGDESGPVGLMLRAIDSKLTGRGMSQKQTREVLAMVEGNPRLAAEVTTAVNAEDSITSPAGYVKSFIRRGGVAKRQRIKADDHPDQDSLDAQMEAFRAERRAMGHTV